MNLKYGFIIASLAAVTPLAAGQAFAIEWYTVDCGGAGPGSPLAGGQFALSSTVGQPDAGVFSGGAFQVFGGFWAAAAGTGCYPNCDGSVGVPLLTPNDFACFLNAYVNGQSYANCDGSVGNPNLTPNDFACFLNSYVNGCS